MYYRFMASGESYRSLAFQFRICHSWISIIVKQTLQAIRHRIVHIAMPSPDEDIFKATATGFLMKWNYPNCIGAVDGKHVRIICPDYSGSMFFNYKEFFSIVLFAIVDHNYKFLVVDVGNYGREGDAGIFSKSAIGQSLNNKTAQLPKDSPLPGTSTVAPHVFIGDEAFKLTPTFMRPYPKEQSQIDEQKAVYNYRHCRARRVSENAFGILCQYFRIFFTPIAVKPETANDLIISACILHNLLRSNNIPHPAESENENTSLPSGNLLPLAARKGNSTRLAYNIRDMFKEYFCSKGSVDWQLDQVRKLK